MFWLVSRSKSRTVYKPLPLGMGFMTDIVRRKFAVSISLFGNLCYRTARFFVFGDRPDATVETRLCPGDG